MKLITSILLVLFMIQLNVGFKLEKAERFKLERSRSLELNQDGLNGNLNANQNVTTSTEHNLDYNHGFKDNCVSFCVRRIKALSIANVKRRMINQKVKLHRRKRFI